MLFVSVPDFFLLSRPLHFRVATEISWYRLIPKVPSSHSPFFFATNTKNVVFTDFHSIKKAEDKVFMRATFPDDFVTSEFHAVYFFTF